MNVKLASYSVCLRHGGRVWRPAGTDRGGRRGDAAAGQKLFQQATIGKSNGPGCVTCHSVEPGKTLLGPSLGEIGTDAAGAFDEAEYKGTAKNAAEWLREAIVNPTVEVGEGFQPGIMPANFGTELTPKQVDDLVAYLLTLK